jgi:hypothetical protein
MEFFNGTRLITHVPATKNGFLVLTCDMISTISATWERKHVIIVADGWTVGTDKMRVGLWVIGAFLAYLLVFLLWFPLGQHSPHSFSARVLGFLFGALMAFLVAIRSRRGFSRRWDWACYRDRNQSIRVN